MDRSYSVLIIDDEAIIITRVAKYLAESGFMAILTAHSGEEALGLIRREKPDIIVSDISMQNLSGIALLEICRKEGIDSRFIMLTGFNDFDYAISALKNNAVDYLLKPISKELLINAMKKAVASIEAETNVRSRIKSLEDANDSTFLFSYLNGQPLNPLASSKLKKILSMEKKQRILLTENQLPKKYSDCGFICLPNGLNLKFIDCINKYEFDNYEISEECSTKEQLEKAFHQCRMKLLSRFFPDGEKSNPDIAETSKIIDQIRSAIKASRYNNLVDIIRQSLKLIRNPAELEYFTAEMIAIFKAKAAENKKASNREFPTALIILEKSRSIDDYLIWLLDLYDEMFKDEKTISNYPLVDRVRYFIDKHFTESNLNLKMIAEATCASPSYISARFSAETGRTVTGYITASRLKKAYELLDKTDLEIQQIAHATGFRDSLYFSKCYKKHFGRAPSVFPRLRNNL